MLLFNQLKLHSKECGLGNRAFIIVSVLDGHWWKGKSVPFGGGGISPATFPRTIHQIFINICFCSFSLKSSRKSPFLSSFVRLFLVSSSFPSLSASFFSSCPQTALEKKRDHQTGFHHFPPGSKVLGKFQYLFPYKLNTVICT